MARNVSARRQGQGKVTHCSAQPHTHTHTHTLAELNPFWLNSMFYIQLVDGGGLCHSLSVMLTFYISLKRIFLQHNTVFLLILPTHTHTHSHRETRRHKTKWPLSERKNRLKCNHGFELAPLGHTFNPSKRSKTQNGQRNEWGVRLRLPSAEESNIV